MNLEERAEKLDDKTLKLCTIMFDAIQKEIKHDDPELGIKATILALCKLSASSLQFISSRYEDEEAVDVFIYSLKEMVSAMDEMETAEDLTEDIIDRLKNK
jgi:hypothetical protein